MSVTYYARVVYGLPIEELEAEEFDASEAEDAGLEVVSPYYDAPYSDSLVGVVIKSADAYGWAKLNLTEIAATVDQAKTQFMKATGRDGHLYLSTHAF